MANLGEFISDGGRPSSTFVSSTAPKNVEPLGGLADIDAAMDAFPEEIYQRGKDSRLYKFVSTLCGDAGAGYIKKQSYIARLRSEGEHIIFKDVDQAYTNTFGMRRLPNEKYDESVDTDSLVEQDWQAIAAKDNAFTQRMQDFFAAVRFGSSPMGMELAARGGAGVDCEVVESYKAIFSAKSDDPLGMELDHPSINHFRIIPYVTDRTGNLNDEVGYSAQINRSLNVTVGNPNTATSVWSTGQDYFYLKPEIERNLISLVDRLRPVGASMSVTTEVRNLLVHESYSTFASSRRFSPIRFITGKGTVNWPTVNSSKGYFIEAGIEHEAPRLPGALWERPTVFFSVLGVKAYTDIAINDPTYNTAAFWDDSITSSPFEGYRSIHSGAFEPFLASIYPAITQVTSQQILDETLALAQPFTPLVITARGTS